MPHPEKIEGGAVLPEPPEQTTPASGPMSTALREQADRSGAATRMLFPAIEGDRRSPTQITAHYQVEKELANRLRTASGPERRRLYSLVYDELFRRVPDHPMLTDRPSAVDKELAISAEVALLMPFLSDRTTFLEVGPGDCALSLQISKTVAQVYAVDVSGEITGNSTRPANFTLIISDGCTIPVPPNSVDVAYSNQLMEHLHPDDAAEQLQNIVTALAPGGLYMCITPNRLTGPHDVSMYFDTVATGFHLKEYTIDELTTVLRRAGFVRVRAHVGGRGRYINLPVDLLIWCEKLLGLLPNGISRSIARSRPMRTLLNIRLGAMKQPSSAGGR
jgi:SAM-dependent methyltransferase